MRRQEQSTLPSHLARYIWQQQARYSACLSLTSQLRSYRSQYLWRARTYRYRAWSANPLVHSLLVDPFLSLCNFSLSYVEIRSVFWEISTSCTSEETRDCNVEEFEPLKLRKSSGWRLWWWSYGCGKETLQRFFFFLKLTLQRFWDPWNLEPTTSGFLEILLFLWSLSFFLIQFKDDKEERRKKARDLEISFSLSNYLLSAFAWNKLCVRFKPQVEGRERVLTCC